ncbi:hypothetical protein [Cellulomonas sp. SLBN-39]|uniref:hypothetical protein n=1 Tax=Cellulomonas sp. SLBN-39 TaxID=2768446 RepID=UPI0011515406|nr:hypothetical protein [Cellulomonas sp. SLBN-39]TQL02641.1 hypothetical protein FBY24_1721 [Cellulomonas sp. SLBN-39]
MRSTSLLVLVGGGLLLLSACAPAAGPASADAGPTATAAAPQESAAGATAPGATAGDGERWCADADVSTRVDAALASVTEGPHNGVLVSPEEMAELGEPEAAIADQRRAWEALTVDEVAFQQCLRVRQGQPIVDPVPGSEP